LAPEGVAADWYASYSVEPGTTVLSWHWLAGAGNLFMHLGIIVAILGIMLAWH
jgi:hypothetical protein